MRLEKLIAAVKKYQLLYDPCNPDYKDIPMRRQIWRQIAKEVNMNDQECQTKWKNLRDTFVRKINQQKNQKISGKDSERTPWRWRYYKELTFLMPYVHPRMPTPYLPTQTEYQDEDEDDEDSSVTHKTNALTNVDGLFDVMIDRVSSDDDCPVRTPIFLQLKKEADTSSEATPAKQQTCDPPTESASTTLAASRDDPGTPETTTEVKSADVKDDVYYFSNFIAERLRSFSPRRRDAKMRSIFTALLNDE